VQARAFSARTHGGDLKSPIGDLSQVEIKRANIATSERAGMSTSAIFWAFIQQMLATALSTAAIGALVVWFGGHWVEARIKSHFDRISEDYKFELRAHEQGVKIAEYAALAIDLKVDDSVETYRRVNQLAWELFLWLPDDVYRKLAKG
jgi:hypothetical protein